MKTIIDFFDPWPARLSLIIFCGVVAMLGYNWINWSCLTASDWGTWIGAIGTVGALVGAIWIANSQARQAHKKEQALAAIAAGTLVIRLKILVDRLEEAKRSLDLLGTILIMPSFSSVAVTIRDSQFWEVSEILPLAVLPDDIAIRLQVARARIDQAVDNIIVVSQMSPQKLIADNIDLSEHLQGPINIAIEGLKRAIVQCEKVLDRVESI